MADEIQVVEILVEGSPRLVEIEVSNVSVIEVATGIPGPRGLPGIDGADGSGAPGGSDTQVQFNDSDTFGGNSGFIYNKVSHAVTITGAFSASNVSGSNTGDQTNITGNAGTATALQTARTINGTSFNGTADVTITSAAGTLTGVTLNATVVSSSLTSVGTITSGVWTGTAIAVANGGTGATTAANARTNLGIANVLGHVFGITIDGGGSPPSTGVKGYFRVPYSGTITKITLLADQTGSAVIDVWKDTYANYPPTVADTITASAKPTLSSAIKAEDSTLTGWNTAITAGDVFGYNLDSVTSCTRLTLEIEYARA